MLQYQPSRWKHGVDVHMKSLQKLYRIYRGGGGGGGDQERGREERKKEGCVNLFS